MLKSKFLITFSLLLSCAFYIWLCNIVKHKPLPTIVTVLKASASNERKWVPPICVLIVCPTRELASQIAAEANVLLKYHEGIGVQTLVGGTRFKVDQKCLEIEPCHICNSFCLSFTGFIFFKLFTCVNIFSNA